MHFVTFLSFGYFVSLLYSAAENCGDLSESPIFDGSFTKLKDDIVCATIDASCLHDIHLKAKSFVPSAFELIRNKCGDKLTHKTLKQLNKETFAALVGSNLTEEAAVKAFRNFMKKNGTNCSILPSIFILQPAQLAVISKKCFQHIVDPFSGVQSNHVPLIMKLPLGSMQTINSKTSLPLSNIIVELIEFKDDFNMSFLQSIESLSKLHESVIKMIQDERLIITMKAPFEGMNQTQLEAINFKIWNSLTASHNLSQFKIDPAMYNIAFPAIFRRKNMDFINLCRFSLKILKSDNIQLCQEHIKDIKDLVLAELAKVKLTESSALRNSVQMELSLNLNFVKTFCAQFQTEKEMNGLNLKILPKANAELCFVSMKNENVLGKQMSKIEYFRLIQEIVAYIVKKNLNYNHINVSTVAFTVFPNETLICASEDIEPQLRAAWKDLFINLKISTEPLADNAKLSEIVNTFNSYLVNPESDYIRKQVDLHLSKFPNSEKALLVRQNNDKLCKAKLGDLYLIILQNFVSNHSTKWNNFGNNQLKVIRAVVKDRSVHPEVFLADHILKNYSKLIQRQIVYLAADKTLCKKCFVVLNGDSTVGLRGLNNYNPNITFEFSGYFPSGYPRYSMPDSLFQVQFQNMHFRDLEKKIDSAVPTTSKFLEWNHPAMFILHQISPFIRELIVNVLKSKDFDPKNYEKRIKLMDQFSLFK